MLVDWNSSRSHLLFNPTHSELSQGRFNLILEQSPFSSPHIWLSTSGSTSAKWVGLSKEAILSSAQGVNIHLGCNSLDTWIHALPDFHVGGLGIWARSFLSGALVCDFKKDVPVKWNAALFRQYCADKKGTLTALVPAQLFDIVRQHLPSPVSMRGVILGGGSLHPELYKKAIGLGWRILPSYGMTECGSQVATAELDSWDNTGPPCLKLLPHFNVEGCPEKRFRLKGPSLLSAYALDLGERIEFVDPKVDGWFVSGDRGEIKGPYIEILGRMDQMVKVGGESVDLARLESVLQSVMLEINSSLEVTLLAFPDERLGNVVHLVFAGTSEDELKPVVDQFQARVLPFERIRQIHFVPAIPRSPLSKVLKADLLRLIKSS